MTSIFSRYLSQLWPTPGPLTANNLPDQSSKIYIITGANSGVGYELTKILYAANATIYLASRSEQKATAAISALQSASPSSTGSLRFLHLDLNDLSSIKAAVAAFAAQESHLHVLWNNAGIAAVPPGTVSAQGYEAHMAVNCLGPFLFTQLLLPHLRAAAALAPANTVRIVWTSSLLVDALAPRGGVPASELAPGHISRDRNRNYAISKAGNWLLAGEFARRLKSHGVVSVTQNPGNLRTNVWREVGWEYWLSLPILYGAEYGALTMLWAGLGDGVTVEDGGRCVVPWGRWHPSPRDDILNALRSREEGGTGEAGEFWKWCEEQTARFK